MRTLNSEQSRRNQEMHVCPLQLDIIKRLVIRYTNAGDTVLDPFHGIGSVGYQSILLGRKAVGVELNEEYWRCSVGYCEMAQVKAYSPTLFDMAEFLPKSTEGEV
jgi:adenine-specific DNA methylase